MTGDGVSSTASGNGVPRIPQRTTVGRLLVGATGSLGVMSLPQYLPILRSFYAAEVRVILTRSAESFVQPKALAIYCDQVSSESAAAEPMQDQLDFVTWADQFIILPATANVLGQAAHGLAISKLSTAVMMWPGAVSFFPNMEHALWEQPAVQRNVAQLREDGHIVFDPVRQAVYVASRHEIRNSLSMPPPNEVIQLLRSTIPEAGATSPPSVDSHTTTLIRR